MAFGTLKKIKLITVIKLYSYLRKWMRSSIIYFSACYRHLHVYKQGMTVIDSEWKYGGVYKTRIDFINFLRVASGNFHDGRGYSKLYAFNYVLQCIWNSILVIFINGKTYSGIFWLNEQAYENILL